MPDRQTTNLATTSADWAMQKPARLTYLGSMRYALPLLMMCACSNAEIDGTLDPNGVGAADGGAMIAAGPDNVSVDAGSAHDAAAVDAGGPLDAGSVDAGPPPAAGPPNNGTADAGSVGWEHGNAAEEDLMVELVNGFRASDQNCGGRSMPAVPPIRMQENLREAARLHSLDMGEEGYFAHNGLAGRDPWQRIRDASYPGRGMAENIAAGNQSAQATFQQWVDSPGHCRNMMTPNATEIGVGHAAVPGSRYRHYWTQKFGTR